MISLFKFKEQGFTLLALLVIINIMGLSLSLSGKYWYTIKIRETEKELLFRGCQFIKAIGNYYLNSPGSTKTYPANLRDLLKDQRSANTTRYIRRIYKDPIKPCNDWGTIVDKYGRIKGVYSTSEMEPLKKEGFPSEISQFTGKEKYSEWKFIYYPPEKNKQGNKRENKK